MVDNTKFLGVWIDNRLKWKTHVDKVSQKILHNQNLLKFGKKNLNIHAKQLIYFAQMQSHLNYCLSTWGNMIPNELITKLQRLQNKSIELINGKKTTKNNYESLGILCITELLKFENCKFGYKLINSSLPIKICELTTTDQSGKALCKNHSYNTRCKQFLNKPLANNKSYTNCIIYKGTAERTTKSI